MSCITQDFQFAIEGLKLSEKPINVDLCYDMDCNIVVSHPENWTVVKGADIYTISPNVPVSCPL